MFKMMALAAALALSTTALANDQGTMFFEQRQSDGWRTEGFAHYDSAWCRTFTVINNEALFSVGTRVSAFLTQDTAPSSINVIWPELNDVPYVDVHISVRIKGKVENFGTSRMKRQAQNIYAMNVGSDWLENVFRKGTRMKLMFTIPGFDNHPWIELSLRGTSKHMDWNAQCRNSFVKLMQKIRNRNKGRRT